MRTAVLIILLLAGVIAFFGDCLVGDRVLITSNTSLWLPWGHYATPERQEEPTYRTDAARTYLPRRVHTSRSVASGRFPLWDSSIEGGAPFFADPQTEVLYTSGLEAVLMDPLRSMGYDVALHFFLAMLGMFLFLGSINASPAGRMLGAIAYGGSSFFFLRMGHPTFVASAAWIPYLFFAYERSRTTFRSGVLLLILFLSLDYLAGMPQVFMFGAAALFVYVLIDCIERLIRGDWQAARKNLGVFLLASAIALLVVAVQLVPFVEFARNSRGLGFDFSTMSEKHLWSPIFLLRAAVPDLFGNPVQGTSWIGLLKGEVHPYNSGFMVYCGVAGLALALAGLVFVKRSRHVRGLLGLGILSVAVGTSSAVLRLIYVIFPPATYSQIDRVSVVTCFALAALAGKGLSLASRSNEPRLRRLFTAIPVAVASGFACTIAVLSVIGPNLFGRLSKEAASFAGQTWFQTGGFKLLAWVTTGGGAWLDYEMRQVGLGLVFALLTAFGTWLYVVRRPKSRLGIAAVWLVALTLALDLGLAARRYYVSQPADCLRATEGIDLLSALAGEDSGSGWRTAGLGASSRVLPVNTPELYGITSFDGLSAMYPSGYIRRLVTTVARRKLARPMWPVPGPVADLMCVRYLVTDRIYPQLAHSPLTEALLGDDRAAGSMKVVDVVGDRRLGLSLEPGEVCSLTVTVPECLYLDFSMAVTGSKTGTGNIPAAETFIRGRGGWEVSTSASTLLEPGEQWRDVRLDVSPLAGERAWVVFRVPEAAGDGGMSVVWSRFEFVKQDCGFREVEGGYEVDACGPDGALALKLEGAGDLFLRTSSSRMPSAYSSRFVEFDKAGESAYILLSAESDGEVVRIVSSEDFRLVGARLVVVSGWAGRDLAPVYDGDMVVYENLAALPRGLCIGQEILGDKVVVESGQEVLRIGADVDDLRYHVSGTATFTGYEDERVVIDVDAERDCILLVQDTWYPGWKARVDGVEAPIIRTDLGIRAVGIAAGRHTVEMEFAPGSIRLGMILSGVGILIGVVYGAKGTRRQT